MSDDHFESDAEIDRRRFLGRALLATGAAAGLSLFSVVGTLRPREVFDPAREPPADGDPLIFADGPRQGEFITPGDLGPDTPVLAFPHGKTANRNNTIALFRFPPAELQGAGGPAVTDQGVVAFSAVCTHLGCIVGRGPAQPLFCHCHGAVFDPAGEARVLAGPAPRPLPRLPVRVEGGRVIAAGGFVTPVGVI